MLCPFSPFLCPFWLLHLCASSYLGSIEWYICPSHFSVFEDEDEACASTWAKTPSLQTACLIFSRSWAKQTKAGGFGDLQRDCVVFISLSGRQGFSLQMKQSFMEGYYSSPDSQAFIKDWTDHWHSRRAEVVHHQSHCQMRWIWQRSVTHSTVLTTTFSAVCGFRLLRALTKAAGISSQALRVCSSELADVFTALSPSSAMCSK